MIMYNSPLHFERKAGNNDWSRITILVACTLVNVPKPKWSHVKEQHEKTRNGPFPSFISYKLQTICVTKRLKNTVTDPKIISTIVGRFFFILDSPPEMSLGLLLANHELLLATSVCEDIWRVLCAHNLIHLVNNSYVQAAQSDSLSEQCWWWKWIGQLGVLFTHFNWRI